jgi:hypothetical protein
MSALSLDPLFLGVVIGIIDDPDDEGTGIAVTFGVHANQVRDSRARDPIEAQLLRRLKAHFAVNKHVVAADKKRVTKTEETDRGSDFTHMSWIEFAEFSGGGSKLPQPDVGQP